jgi:hypothetical protein
MAKRFVIIILFLSVFISACQEKKQNKPVIQTSKKVSNQTNSVRYKKSNISGITFTDGSPKVTLLPFWSNDWPKAGKKISIEMKNYRLPIIKSIRYMNLDSLNGYLCTNGEPIDSSVLKLTAYNYKFPNIGKYQVFYRWLSDESLEKDPLLLFIQNNCNMVFNNFGYLILYDPITMNAIVIDIANDYYIDSEESRDFYIDKHYTIHLMDRGWTDGEDSHGNQTAEYLGAIKRTISILKNGEIKIADNK